jgi:hypothetical protein
VLIDLEARREELKGLKQQVGSPSLIRPALCIVWAFRVVRHVCGRCICCRAMSPSCIETVIQTVWWAMPMRDKLIVC